MSGIPHNEMKRIVGQRVAMVRTYGPYMHELLFENRMLLTVSMDEDNNTFAMSLEEVKERVQLQEGVPDGA